MIGRASAHLAPPHLQGVDFWSRRQILPSESYEMEDSIGGFDAVYEGAHHLHTDVPQFLDNR